MTGSTKELYAELYLPEGHNYGSMGRKAVEYEEDSRAGGQGRMLVGNLHKLALPASARVLEVGCGMGHLHWAHPGWQGLEYSPTAVRLAKSVYGPDLNIVEGDARNLPFASDSVDMVCSFAALEHVPGIERAFAEIERVLKPGGVALLAPAWNCRSWTVKKLKERPYSECTLAEKLGKFLIPMRNSLAFRMLVALPKRLLRELGGRLRRPYPLKYRPLHPRFDLMEKYGHDSDDDAFVDIDAQAALIYFHSRGWDCLSHPTLARRFMCRGEEIVVRKP